MLVLRRKDIGTAAVDVAGVTPDRLSRLSLAEIERVAVEIDGRPAALGEAFAVSGDAADAVMHVEGDCRGVSRLGARMLNGRLEVHGSVGPHAGAQMAGGHFEIHGDADDWAGAEMRGGMLRIRGSAGRRAGAAYAGSFRGMRGGVLLIHGSAGDELGAVLRRGLIAIGGLCGNFVAAGAIAGTVVVAGTVGRNPVAGLKRGTLMTFGPLPNLLPTFRFECSYRPPIIDLYLRQLRRWGWPVRESWLAGSVQRFRGDFVSLGKGDVLAWSPA